jgi:hypothetical protein
MEKYGLRRIGAACAISGVVITAISNGMHPDLPDPAGIVQNAREL